MIVFATTFLHFKIDRYLFRLACMSLFSELTTHLKYQLRRLTLYLGLGYSCIHKCCLVPTWYDSKINGITQYLKWVLKWYTLVLVNVKVCALNSIFLKNFFRISGHLPWQELHNSYKPVVLIKGFFVVLRCNVRGKKTNFI